MGYKEKCLPWGGEHGRVEGTNEEKSNEDRDDERETAQSEITECLKCIFGVWYSI